ncbi:sperm acrosome-associated protein 5-like [Anguilla rostrata]|uniref:sperm acrosome-associated protein 5-like n=1 Tax=Anguilla rostrata TaxID=7938 RepID=UPI0030D60531
MKTATALEILALATVAALVINNAEGQSVTKCTLKKKLEEAGLPLPDNSRENGLTKQNLLAKIVCKVEVNTGFNTSAVSHFEMGGKSSVGSKSRGSSRQESASSDAHSSESHEEDIPITTLYGLFQLPGTVACTNGSNPSLNICQMDCAELIDDDITDDIACLKTLLTPDSSDQTNEDDDDGDDDNGSKWRSFFKDMWKPTFPKACEKVSKFFSNCV